MLQQCFPDKVKRSQVPGVFQRENYQELSCKAANYTKTYGIKSFIFFLSKHFLIKIISKENWSQKLCDQLSFFSIPLFCRV